MSIEFDNIKKTCMHRHFDMCVRDNPERPADTKPFCHESTCPRISMSGPNAKAIRDSLTHLEDAQLKLLRAMLTTARPALEQEHRLWNERTEQFIIEEQARRAQSQEDTI